MKDEHVVANERPPANAENSHDQEEAAFTERSAWSVPEVEPSPRTALDIEDFLNATSDASRRTRAIFVILAVAGVLIFTGLSNSLQWQWMHSRMKALSDIHSQYTESKLGPFPDVKDSKAIEFYEKRYLALCSAIEQAYAESALLVRVPILGFSIDVNDLGVVGGMSIFVILACYRFFLSREIDNLRLSFNEARNAGVHKLDEFYKLLAMRQVFTIPKTFINRTAFLRSAPYIVIWFPTGVLACVLVNDLRTAFVGHALGEFHYYTNVVLESLVLILVIVLSQRVTIRMKRTEEIWAGVWVYMTSIGNGDQNAVWPLEHLPPAAEALYHGNFY